MSLDPDILRQRLQNARLYLVLTRAACRHPPEQVLRHALAAGVDVVQVREPDACDHEVLEWVHCVRDHTAAAHVPLIVNDRPDLALLGGADGVHLGQGDLPARAVRELLDARHLIGLSTHGREQVLAAREMPVDYLGLGPVFDTATKGLAGRGVQLLAEALPDAHLPTFPIGGVDAHSVTALHELGVRRAAVCSAICAAEDPGQVARELLDALRP